MTASDVNILIGSVLAVAAVCGTGVRWLLMYIDGLQAKSELAETKARGELSTNLYEEIRMLRLELSNAQAEKRLFLRRIFQLESHIHAQPGMTMPEMDGWPPE
jgi:hypothetical protein